MIIGTFAYLPSFVVLAFWWWARSVGLRTLKMSFVLLALGFLLTFPPVFEALAPAE